MRIRRMAAIWFAMMLMMSSAAMAENFQFVDANGSTGYYVDVDSVWFEGENISTARVAVKKAAMNRMFLYTIRFDAGPRAYQILGSQVVEYDTGKVLESKNGSDVSRPYGVASPMNSIVEYIHTLKPEEKHTENISQGTEDVSQNAEDASQNP